MTEFLTPLHIIFYVFAALAVGSALFVISAKNPVHNVLSLVLTFFATAGVWMLLHAEFLALILVLVYVGAVMTLFLFVVMMLNIDREDKRAGFVRYLPFGVLVILLLMGLSLATIAPKYFGLLQMPLPAAMPAGFSNTAQLGMILFTEYAYPFEIAGVLLLAAIIAAITLAYRKPTRRRVQDIGAQIAVKPSDRLHLIKMPATPRKR